MRRRTRASTTVAVRALFPQVLGESEPMPEGSVPVRGYDFNQGCDMNALLASFATTGFQARPAPASAHRRRGCLL